MVRRTQIDLREALDHVDEQLDAVADAVATAEAEANGDVDVDTVLSDWGRSPQELERHYAGLSWAVDPPTDEDGNLVHEPWESVTITEMTAGAYVKAGARAHSDAESAGDVTGADTERLYRVAQSIESADFVNGRGTFDDTLIAVGQLNVQFFTWLEWRIDDFSSPSIKGNGFAARLRDKRSANEHNSSSRG